MVGSVAKRYAKALIELATEDNKLDKVLGDLEQFKNLLEANEELTVVLTEPVASTAERAAVLKAVLDGLALDVTVRNFLLLVMDKDRMERIFDIYDHSLRISDRIKNQTRATVKSAKPLDEPALKRISEKLEEVTSRKVIVNAEVDPSLLAGVVTQLGDYVLDGSLKMQLETIKETIKKG